MEELTDSEKISLGTTEIAKRIRNQLKTEFPLCKFSVTKESYSGGSSITVALIKSNIRIKKLPDEINENNIYHVYLERNDIDSLRDSQKRAYHQLNVYALRDEYNEQYWCNGVFLTEQGHNLLKRVVNIVNYYNYDHSDPQTDYFNTNFYLHLNLGGYEDTKHFIDGTETIKNKNEVD